jgi:tRNA G18 (ribose-2'-O)-methylase SpoU
MALIPVERADDPRLEPYQNLKDRELARSGDLFIAESELVVQRLIASGIEVVSILAIDRKAAALAALVPDTVPVYDAPPAVVNSVMGFKFHSGVLAVGRRPANRPLEAVLPASGQCGVVVVPETNNTENLGLILRVASGFGVNAVLLGEKCCDPWFRQSVRVSMGNVFNLPIVRSTDFEQDLHNLRQRWGIERFATVLDADAQPLNTILPPARWALLFGHEAEGLKRAWVEACDRRVTIPMRHGTDSLNVAIAAGIFLYHFSSLTPASAPGSSPPPSF